VVTPVAPLLYKDLPAGFVGPPDPFGLLKVDAMNRFIESENTPFLWKVGGYYVWCDGDDGWTVDGSLPCDPTFVRNLLLAQNGQFQRME
jgi:hypothetical protein